MRHVRAFCGLLLPSDGRLDEKRPLLDLGGGSAAAEFEPSPAVHLCPYQQRSIGSIDALTRCLLMQRHVNRSGIGVLERQFVKDAEQYANAIRDRSPDGRRRWVLYFSTKLSDAMFEAYHEVERVKDHIEREPWLDAPPLSAREQEVYDFILRQRKATSNDVATALGSKASNLRMVQRDLARLAELGLIEKVGARKDAWYRPLGVSSDPDLDPPETPAAAIGVRVR